MTMMTKLTVLLGLLLAVPLTASDEIPGQPQKQPIALVNGTVYPVASMPIENGVVVFEDGKIIAVGKQGDVVIPGNAEIISVEGLRVYPSLFEAHSILGLIEISSVRATRDQRETDTINPNVRAFAAVNPDSELIPVARANGVLLALSAPEGGLISGQASVLQLDGWTTEDLALKQSAGMIVNWPAVKDDLEDPDKNKSDRIDELREIIKQTRSYEQARKTQLDQQPTDLKLEAMIPVVNRVIPMYVWADSLSTIQSAVAFAVTENVKLVIFGGNDADLCSDLLKKHDIPVVISSAYRLPRRRNDPFDSAYTLPERLRQKGVRFCLSGSNASHNSTNTRNLPYHAGVAVAYGLPADEALRSITLSPAEILEVADRVGSIEAGKDATLIVTDGDPLETPTNVTAAWVQGRRVDLNNRHRRLFEKYQNKYLRQNQ